MLICSYICVFHSICFDLLCFPHNCSRIICKDDYVLCLLYWCVSHMFSFICVVRIYVYIYVFIISCAFSVCLENVKVFHISSNSDTFIIWFRFANELYISVYCCIFFYIFVDLSNCFRDGGTPHGAISQILMLPLFVFVSDVVSAFAISCFVHWFWLIRGVSLLYFLAEMMLFCWCRCICVYLDFIYFWLFLLPIVFVYLFRFAGPRGPLK